MKDQSDKLYLLFTLLINVTGVLWVNVIDILTKLLT